MSEPEQGIDNVQYPNHLTGTKSEQKKIMPCCTAKCCRWTTLSFGIFFIILGVLLLVFWSNIVILIKDKHLSVANEDTTEYKMWKETPIPMYLEVYLFNWTNANEVIQSKWKIKPAFAEKGPYTFAEKHYRKQVVFNHNHTVTYNTQKIWHFRPNMSQGTLEDEITTVNTILLVVGQLVKNRNRIVKMGVNFILKEKNINFTVTKPVREFLFDGYEDPILDLLEKLHLKNIVIPFTKFGWFANRNGSIDYDGIYNMYDGSDDVRKLGRIIAWNYNTTSNYYLGNCGKIEGTSGELWYPVEDDREISIFSSDLCSPLTLMRNGTDRKLDIEGHKFIGEESVYDNGTKYPEMACFSSGEVVRSGVRNVSDCKFGAPAFVSYPHFYLADSYYRDSIVGMKPNATKHQMFMSLEPETGIPLEAYITAQVNLRVQNISAVTLFENVKEHFIPALWFKQYALIDDELANQAKLLLKDLPAIGIYVGSVILVVGSILIIVFTVMVLKNRKKESDEEGLLNHENS